MHVFVFFVYEYQRKCYVLASSCFAWRMWVCVCVVPKSMSVSRFFCLFYLRILYSYDTFTVTHSKCYRTMYKACRTSFFYCLIILLSKFQYFRVSGSDVTILAMMVFEHVESQMFRSSQNETDITRRWQDNLQSDGFTILVYNFQYHLLNSKCICFITRSIRDWSSSISLIIKLSKFVLQFIFGWKSKVLLHAFQFNRTKVRIIW